MRALSTEQNTACSESRVGGSAGRPTVAKIDLAALAHNFDQTVRHAAGRKVLAVVKANAYGHGAVPVSRHLLSLGASMLGVALVEEGEELRNAGIDAPLLVMGPLFPEQAEAAVELGLTPVVFSMQFAEALSSAAMKAKKQIPVHVKIDTGMGRIGISPNQASEFIGALNKMPNLTVQGLMTHLADADLPDKEFATGQVEQFRAVINRLEEQGVNVPLRHAANSAAVLDFNRALFTMVRPGLMLYGYNPREKAAQPVGLQPVLSLMTRIAFIKKTAAGVPISYGRTFVTSRESLIATLPVGYADGFSRGLSNSGEALVRGVRVPVIGRVCMDMCMIDVTGITNVAEGDSVTLIGSQGSEHITADDLAAKTGTISYEVLCGISSRVPRKYE